MVIAAQEIDIATRANLQKFIVWAKKRHWHALVWPSMPCDGGHTSAGVAILARSFVVLRHLWPHEDSAGTFVPHRVGCAVASPPGGREFALYTAYLVSGQGVGDRNTEIMQKIAQHRLSHDWHCIVAGDVQAQPTDWIQSP